LKLTKLKKTRGGRCQRDLFLINDPFLTTPNLPLDKGEEPSGNRPAAVPCLKEKGKRGRIYFLLDAGEVGDDVGFEGDD